MTNTLYYIICMHDSNFEMLMEYNFNTEYIDLQY